MATLEGQSIASSYEQLLSLPDGGGNTTTLVAITDGDAGTTFCLQLATTKAMIEGSGSKLFFSDEGGEYISGNGTDLTITSGNDIVLALGAAGSVYHTGDGGTSNTIYGKNAGDALDSGGNYNIFLGEEAGGAMATGTNNIAIGYGAFDAADAGEDDNIAIGLNALGDVNHASTVRNIAIGSGAGDGMGGIQGANKDNIFIGYDAGGGTWLTAVSDHNIGIGNNVMDAAMNGAIRNTAVGSNCLTGLTEGSNNVIMGYEAGKVIADGNSNVALGYTALLANISGVRNVCVGESAGVAITASENICIGYQSGNTLDDGGGNVVVGHGALTGATNSINQVVLGKEATGVADYSVTLGNASTTAVYMAQDSGAKVHCAGVASSDDIVMADGKGIDFAAYTDGSVAGSTSSALQILDDYEEGTWTPVLKDNSDNAAVTNANGWTHGNYTKIGNKVFLQCTMNTSAFHGSTNTATDTVFIHGLPYTMNAAHICPITIYGAQLAITAGHALSGRVGNGATKIQLQVYDDTGGVTSLIADEWSVDGYANITAVYHI